MSLVGIHNDLILRTELPGFGGRLSVIFGGLAFALFFLGDLNDWKLGRRALRACFPAGFLLLAAATAVQALRGSPPPMPAALRGVFFVLSAVFVLLELAALFAALPAGEAYGKTGETRAACTGGMYALCRHPGVLWFIPLYACLWLAFGLPAAAAALYSALDLLLILFEDRVVFPARLNGYDEYRRTTPFLIPSRASVRAFHKTRMSR